MFNWSPCTILRKGEEIDEEHIEETLAMHLKNRAEIIFSEMHISRKEFYNTAVIERKQFISFNSIVPMTLFFIFYTIIDKPFAKKINYPQKIFLIFHISR